MNYFRVYVDFNRYVQIYDYEYEKALYAFLKGQPVVFENGAVSRIESILPDVNRMMGWNSDYKPNQDNNAEIESCRRSARPFMEKIKDRVEYLIDTKQENLIGKNVDIPELSAPKNPEISTISKELSDKFKIN